jgi:IclR family acetate operon transcriptional repressor
MRSTVYNSCGLPQQTPNTITDVDTLESQLEIFRAQGYTVDHGENELGVNGVATWIVNGLGEVAAAISVAGPANRLSDDVMKHIAVDVVAAADSIAAAIRGVERPDNLGARRRQ